MTVNQESLKQMLLYYRKDEECLEMILDALTCFEEYHQAIYQQEIKKQIYGNGTMEGEAYRRMVTALDSTRTIRHNAVLAQVNMLNRMAQSAGLPSFYDGMVSEERPYRREVADAVCEFITAVIQNRC